MLDLHMWRFGVQPVVDAGAWSGGNTFARTQSVLGVFPVPPREPILAGDKSPRQTLLFKLAIFVRKYAHGYLR